MECDCDVYFGVWVGFGWSEVFEVGFDVRGVCGVGDWDVDEGEDVDGEVEEWRGRD